MNRESLEFGRGSFVGAVMADQGFFEMPIHDQARMMGWAASCPIVEELTDPNNSSPGRGPEVMNDRYAQVNFWFGYIARELAEMNPALSEQLMTSVKRRVDEPVGKFEPESVPENYTEEMSPMATLPGYALPRLFIEQVGIGKGLPAEQVRARFAIACASLKYAASEATTPSELLALVAEDAAVSDVEPSRALYHTLSQGWMVEHNAGGMLQEVKDALAVHAPELWGTYSNLSDAERAEQKLA